jgi:hypothetical protein
MNEDLKVIIKGLLMFLLGVGVIVIAILALVFLLSLLFHGIPWVWNL